MFYNNFHKFVSFKSYFVWKHFTDSESAFSEFFTWKWKSLSHVRLFVTPWTIQFMDFSRPEYWRGRCSLLQGIFPIQGLNPGLPHCRWILYQLRHQGSPISFLSFFFFFFNINWNTFGYSPALGTSIHVKNTEDCNFLEKTTGDSSKGESGQWTQLSRCYMKEEENISKVCLMLPVMNLAVRVKVSWYCKDIWDWFC